MDSTALYKVGYGLYLLSAKENEKDNGCIINTFMQITSTGDPLISIISVSKQNFTHDMILNTKQFTVSALTQDTPFELIQRFGFQSGRNVDKFAGFDEVTRAKNGLLYLTNHANSYFECKVTDTYDFNTHTLFRAEINEAEHLSDGLSVTYHYYYNHIKPAPVKTEKKGYRCKICGYVYEGEPLPADFICPICKHGAVDFEKI